MEMSSAIKDLDAAIYAVNVSHAMLAMISERSILLRGKRCTCHAKEDNWKTVVTTSLKRR